MGDNKLKTKKDLGMILLAGIMSIFVYSFLHELGHCIAVWIYGGRVTEFNFIFLWNAHMRYEEAAWKPLVDLAGTLLPTLIAFCLLLTYRRVPGRKFVNYLETIYIFECITSLGSWVYLTILYLNGYWDSSSDEMKFIMKSGISPVAVIFAAVAVILLMVFIFIKKLQAAASSEWRKKNIGRAGILLAGVMLLVNFTMPLFLYLDALTETGGSFRLTEKDGSPDSILTKQYEVEIEDSGTYVLKMHWGGECSGVITGATLSLGDEVVFWCTAEKIFMETVPRELESGIYTLSLYCLNSMEEWEEFFAMLGKETAETDYDFQSDGRYAVFGGYEVVKER